MTTAPLPTVEAARAAYAALAARAIRHQQTCLPSLRCRILGRCWLAVEAASILSDNVVAEASIERVRASVAW